MTPRRCTMLQAAAFLVVCSLGVSAWSAPGADDVQTSTSPATQASESDSEPGSSLADMEANVVKPEEYVPATQAGETTGSDGLPDTTVFERYVAAKSTSEIKLGLQEIVLRTLCQNLGIKVSDLANRIAHDEFHAQQGIFDLRLNASVQSTRIHEQIAVDPKQATPGQAYTVTKAKNVEAAASLSQLLPTGGVVELLFGDAKHYTNSPGYLPQYYNASAGVQITQPLLKNAGPLVTQSAIIIAQYDNMITAAGFRLQVMQQVSASLLSYLDLMFAVANVDVLRISLAQAQELLRVNKAKYDAGVLPELDVLQAQSEVASRKQQVIAAIQEVERVSDQLKTQLAEICEMQRIAIRPSEEPFVPSYDIDEEKFLEQAKKKRPEYDQAWWNIEKQNMNRIVAQNQTLPQLDLSAGYTGIGTHKHNSNAIENIRRDDFRDWNVGLQFSYPLQNRQARYRQYEAEKQLDTAFLNLQQLRDNVMFQVRSGIRDVETNREQIFLGKATVEFNKSKVDTGMKRQAVGLATTFDVLSFQTDLAQSRINLLKAIVLYNKAIVQLEFYKGTLLDRLNISVDEGALKVPKRIPKKPLQVNN